MKKYPTKEERQIANKGNVVEFAEKMGIDLERVGSDSYKGVEHDSLVITPSRNAWYWNSRSIGGYGAKSFAEKYILAETTSMTDIEKANKAVEMVLDANVSSGGNKLKKESFKYNTSQESQLFTQTFDYLTKVRKLNPKTVESLHRAGLIKQDQYGNALFIWKNPQNKKVVGVSVQGTKINHKKFGKRGTLKRIEKNSTPQFGFAFDVSHKGQTPENLVFCESSIDAISFYDAAKESGKPLQNTRIVSMEGLKKGTLLNYVDMQSKTLNLHGKKLKSVKLAVDRDEAGDNFIKSMQELQANAKQIEDDFTQRNLKKAKTDDFAADIEKAQHEEKYSAQFNLANAPELQIAQIPESAPGKDWNEFLKQLRVGSIHIETKKVQGSNLTVEKGQNNQQNKKQASNKKYQQYLAQQRLEMS